MIRLWPFTKDMLIRPIQWLVERKMVFNRSGNKEARKFREGGKWARRINKATIQSR
jgi:hypothetical protein